MNPNHRRIHFQGKDYIWTGAEWYEAGTHLTPPAGIIHDLNTLIEDDQRAEDSLLDRVPQLLPAACQARDAGQYRRAEELLDRAQFMEPGNLAVLTVLSSVYPRAAILRGPSPQPKPIALPTIPPCSPPAPRPSATSAA